FQAFEHETPPLAWTESRGWQTDGRGDATSRLHAGRSHYISPALLILPTAGRRPVGVPSARPCLLVQADCWARRRDGRDQCRRRADVSAAGDVPAVVVPGGLALAEVHQVVSRGWRRQGVTAHRAV